jgi:DNA primase
MARIADDELERLKSEISLERLVRARGVELRKHGADLIGLCPFHNDHEPSLVITPEKNLWHCLGACQTGGSVIDWTMKTQGVSFRHAVELLRADFFPLAASSSRVVKVATVPILAAPVSVDMEDRELLGRVVEYYNETLKQSPEALGYLERRGIKSAEAIDRFKLGFANRTLGLRLPAKNRKEGEELRTRLAKLGIIREETGHEHFNGSLVTESSARNAAASLSSRPASRRVES